MLFRTIASVFFLEVSLNDDLAKLLRRAGMTDISQFDGRTRGALGFPESDREVLGGMWGAFQKTWAIVDDLERLRCLQLYSSAAPYLDATRKARESNAFGPLLEYVYTFRHACQSLNPQTALLDTRPHYEDEQWENKEGSRTFALEQAPLVACDDSNALANKHFSLLYLRNDMLAYLTDLLPPSERDVEEMPTGRLIFARSGPSRMA